MGSWSIYCGISNITITEGTEMVLLPIKPNKHHEGYQPYVPATLPIFGKYGDYGRIIDIERDKNVEIIEEYFGLPIDEFVTYFTDILTYDRNNSEYNRVREVFETKHLETKDWDFLFIHREVWDFISTGIDCTDGDIPIPGVFKSLGFEEIEEGVFIRGKYTFELDGYHYKVNEDRFYTIERSHNEVNFIDLIGLNDDEKRLLRQPFYKLLKYMDLDQFNSIIGRGVFGRFYSKQYQERDIDSILLKLETDSKLRSEMEKGIELAKLTFLTEKNQGMVRAYKENITGVRSLVGNVYSFINNLYCGSYTLKPNIIHVTPQCGEFRLHQKILDKFSEINRKSYGED